MDKKDIIIRFFQKVDELHMDMPEYAKVTGELFAWLQKSDAVAKDLTTQFFPERSIEAKIISRHDAIVAGIEEVTAYFGKDIAFVINIPDGEKAEKDECILSLSGNSKTILSLERIILNILQRMTGIATQTHAIIHSLSSEKNPYIAATRKTPWTLLDKKAVAVGEGLTHRLTLSDGILIKDNHLELLRKEGQFVSEAETVTEALKNILPSVQNMLVEIEVNTAEGANAAMEVYKNIASTNYLAILLDNWQKDDATEFIKKNIHEQIIFEASGNMNEKNIAQWATTGVDIISLGALTHSIQSADLSLEIV